MVYVIGNDEIIKIGYTKNASSLKRRIKSLQTGCPFTLKIIKTFPKWTMKEERNLHKRFEEFRTSGEWFTYTDIIKKTIFNLKLKEDIKNMDIEEILQEVIDTDLEEAFNMGCYIIKY